MEPSVVLLRPFIGQLYQPLMIDDDYYYGTVGGMKE
jgi:hypothetical protein